MVKPLAIAPVLLAQLQGAVTSLLEQGELLKLCFPAQSAPPIPLYRAKDNQHIIYISPVALQLAKQGSKPPLEIATAIANCFRDSRPPDSALTFEVNDWILRVVPPGKLYLQLTDPGIATWLQKSVAWDLSPALTPEPRTPFTSPDLFSIQYAHARCCALLRLAHRDGLITQQTVVNLATPGASDPSIASVIAPDSIPWLDSQSQLKPCHPAERALISQAIATVDALSSTFPLSQLTSPVSRASLLSQDFLTFHAQCQIWGALRSLDPELGQARLGLVALSQKLLKHLLERELGSFAPVEL